MQREGAWSWRIEPWGWSSNLWFPFPLGRHSLTLLLSQSVLFPPNHRQLSLSPSVSMYLSVRLRRRTLPLQTSSGMLLVGRAKRVPTSRSPFIPVTRSRSRERRRATNYKLHVLAVYLHDRWQYCALFVSADQMPACTNVPSSATGRLSFSFSLRRAAYCVLSSHSCVFNPLGSSRCFFFLFLLLYFFFFFFLFFFFRRRRDGDDEKFSRLVKFARTNPRARPTESNWCPYQVGTRLLSRTEGVKTEVIYDRDTRLARFCKLITQRCC